MGCYFLLQGIFPTQESSPGPLHCRQILYWQSYDYGDLNLFIVSAASHSYWLTFQCAKWSLIVKWLLYLQTESLKISSWDNCCCFCSCCMSKAQIPHTAIRPRPDILVALWFILLSALCFHCPWSIVCYICGERVLWDFYYLLWDQTCLQECIPDSQTTRSRNLTVMVRMVWTQLHWNSITPKSCPVSVSWKKLVYGLQGRVKQWPFPSERCCSQTGDRRTQRCPAGWSVSLLPSVPFPGLTAHTVGPKQPHTYNQTHEQYQTASHRPAREGHHHWIRLAPLVLD